MSKQVFVFLLIVLNSFFSSVRAANAEPWWQNAVFYQLWPSSFYDTNGDGIGDLNGITAQLNYLKKLGVTAVWLNPILRSPSYHGYDTTDFTAIDPRYGTLDDFRALVHSIHQQGLRLLFDLTINHVSKDHPWFQKSEMLEPPYSTYFIWKSQKELEGSGWRTPWSSAPANPKQDWKSVWHLSQSRLEAHRRAFPDALHSDRPIYYYGVFGRKLPDLNYQNKNLREEIAQITSFWLREGVDGFRIDGARYLIEEETATTVIQADSKETIAFWKEFGCFVKNINPEAFLVAEIWASNKTISSYYQKSSCGLDAAFDFTFGNELSESAKVDTMNSEASKILNKKGLGFSLVNSRESKNHSAPWSFYSPFLSNHDQIRFSQGVQGHEEYLKTAATALLTSPGSPFIYYGEEIGQGQPRLEESPDNRDDLFKRAPLFWSTAPNAGFSTGSLLWVDDPLWFPWRPNHQAWWNEFFELNKNNNPDFSVESQMGNENSLWHHYQRLIEIRQTHKILRNTQPGSMKFLAENGELAAYRRIDENQKELIVLINPTTKARRVNLPSSSDSLYKDLLSDRRFKGQEPVTIAPFESLILEPFIR